MTHKKFIKTNAWIKKQTNFLIKSIKINKSIKITSGLENGRMTHQH